MVGSERALKIISSQSPCNGQGQFPMDLIFQSSIQLGPEHFQRWDSQSVSGQPVPVPDSPCKIIQASLFLSWLVLCLKEGIRVFHRVCFHMPTAAVADCSGNHTMTCWWESSMRAQCFSLSLFQMYLFAHVGWEIKRLLLPPYLQRCCWRSQSRRISGVVELLQ